MKGKKRREKIAKKNSQFNPKIHELGRQGFGFQMKKGYKPTKDDIETLRKRAEKERTKAWRKGKVSHADEEE